MSTIERIVILGIILSGAAILLITQSPQALAAYTIGIILGQMRQTAYHQREQQS